MAFDVMDVFVKIGADTSGLESGIDKAKGLAGGLGSAVSGGIKMAGAAIAGATTAVGAFAAESVKVGAGFDSSMAQVAATMGKTVDEIGELRDFAQDMGAKTAFSATQAADALNYMALAGYDADQSMGMLPNVLNLAAAGSMELATASDMVTDAQSALGLEMEDMTGFVDQMAQTASKSNTSVQQLGDAILTVGGTAKTLAGGTTELNASLGILADNGIKGAEGGTKLRNVILSLSAPTDKAAAMLDDLGVSAVDANGDLRPLEDIMGELSGSLDGLGTAERAEIINTIFNKQDIAAVNALLDTSADRWGELTEAIDDSEGAAEKMANTQLDNLAGDVTLFKSALEGAQILISDQLTPDLREFVQFGTEGISKISDGFKEGGLEGAMQAFGEVLSDGLNMIIGKLPDFINAGMQLLGALGQGLLDNLPTILSATKDIILMIGKGLIEAAPSLLEGAMEIIRALGEFLIENGPSIISAVTELLVMIVNMIAENAEQMVQGAIALITGIAQALIENLDILLPAIVQMLVAISLALIENLPLLVESVINLTISLAQAIIENAPLILDAVLQIAQAVIELIVEYGGMLFESASEAFNNLVTGIGEWMSTMINTAIEWLSQLPTQMAYWAGFAIGSFLKFFMELPENLKQWFNETKQKAVEFGTEFKNEAINTGKNFFNGIVDNIKQLPSRLASLANSLVSAVASLPSRFAEVGSNIVQGLWNGIQSGWDWLTSAVSDLANSLLEGAKAALGISSPSKEFAYVGHMVDAGFAQGIQKYRYMIQDAMDGITKDMVDYSPQVAFVNGFTGDMPSVGGYNQTINIYSPTALTPSEVARQTRNATRDMVLELRGKR